MVRWIFTVLLVLYILFGMPGVLCGGFVFILSQIIRIIRKIFDHIRRSPFSYPYFEYSFNIWKIFGVCGKTWPDMDGYLNDFLVSGGFEEVERHRRDIEQWKHESLHKVYNSIFKKFRLAQYQQSLDDRAAYRFYLVSTEKVRDLFSCSFADLQDRYAKLRARATYGISRLDENEIDIRTPPIKVDAPIHPIKASSFVSSGEAEVLSRSAEVAASSHPVETNMPSFSTEVVMPVSSAGVDIPICSVEDTPVSFMADPMSRPMNMRQRSGNSTSHSTRIDKIARRYKTDVENGRVPYSAPNSISHIQVTYPKDTVQVSKPESKRDRIGGFKDTTRISKPEVKVDPRRYHAAVAKTSSKYISLCQVCNDVPRIQSAYDLEIRTKNRLPRAEVCSNMVALVAEKIFEDPGIFQDVSNACEQGLYIERMFQSVLATSSGSQNDDWKDACQIIQMSFDKYCQVENELCGEVMSGVITRPNWRIRLYTDIPFYDIESHAYSTLYDIFDLPCRVELITEAQNKAVHDHMIKSSIDEIDAMDGDKFEHFCASLLRRDGFNNVTVTPPSNDDGADIIAEKDGTRYAVQCKRYKKPLGKHPIQEVFTSLNVYDCKIGIVFTNSYFTNGAKKLAKKNGVLLWDREKLIDMMSGFDE